MAKNKIIIHKPRQLKYQTKRKSWQQIFTHKKYCLVVLLSSISLFTGLFQEVDSFLTEAITIALPMTGTYMSGTAVAGLAAAGLASVAAIGAVFGKLALRAKPLINALSRLAEFSDAISEEDIQQFRTLLDSGALQQLQSLQ